MGRNQTGWYGYQGRWAWVDLTSRRVRVEPADAETCRRYIGGRGVQARILGDHLAALRAPLVDPLSPANRIVIGTGPLNDTPIPTSGRGSCSFVSPMTRSPEPAPWIPDHTAIYGLLTHSSAGGVFPDMLKRAGIDQLIVDGRSDRPARIVIAESGIDIVDAEPELFADVGGRRTLRTTAEIETWLSSKYPGASTLATGPAGWNRVVFACLTCDGHRNFGRGGAGAIFGAKNLVAITAQGRRSPSPFDRERFGRASSGLDEVVRTRTADPSRTSSFRPREGTTWWLDRAFNGGYMGRTGGYLPWHNFDEGSFDAGDFDKVGTRAFLEIAGRHKVCNRCRHVMCTRAARIADGPFAGEGVRPEFETIALAVNCGLLDRGAIFELNRRCNTLGLDTMTFGGVMSAALELSEKGLLRAGRTEPSFGRAEDILQTLEEIAYQSGDIGCLLSTYSDDVIRQLSATRPPADRDAVAACVTTAFAGLGYAGIQPKVFPGMFAAYSTSNRGRGDHTYAWTVQAEEEGLREPAQLAACVAASQVGKALVDSLGLCDFFPADITGEAFREMYQALTGFDYTADSLLECGRRIYALERRINNAQGRARAYDAYIHPKLMVPMTAGPYAGASVDVRLHAATLDAYYACHGWTIDGTVPTE